MLYCLKLIHSAESLFPGGRGLTRMPYELVVPHGEWAKIEADCQSAMRDSLMKAKGFQAYD